MKIKYWAIMIVLLLLSFFVGMNGVSFIEKIGKTVSDISMTETDLTSGFDEWGDLVDGTESVSEDVGSVSNDISSVSEDVTEISDTVFAKRTDVDYEIPDLYNTGTRGELTDFFTLYPDVDIVGNMVSITRKFVRRYGNEIGNFYLEGYGLYFAEGVGDFKVYNSKFVGALGVHYAVQLTGDYLASGAMVTVEDCEGSYYNSAFNTGQNFSFINCYIHDMYQDAFKADNNISIKNSYIRGCGVLKDSHADGVQVSSNEDEIYIEIVNTRFEQPYMKGQYYENACVFIKLTSGASGSVTLSDLYMNGGNYALYLLQDEENDYSGMQYIASNVQIGDSSRYGKQDVDSDISGTLDIEDTQGLYVGSVFRMKGEVYVSVTNDTAQERTLRVETENETKEFVIKACWDGASEETVTYLDLPVDMLCQLDEAKTVSCYEGDTLIGQFTFSE